MFKFNHKRESQTLTKQRVFKRDRGYGKKITRLKTICYLVICSVFLFFYFNPDKYYEIFSKKTTSLEALSVSWEVVVLSDTKSPKQKEQIQDILKIIDKTITNGNNASLSTLAKKIQNNSFFSQVTIVKNFPRKISVFLKERTPVMAIASANNKYLLSNKGEVYGSYSPKTNKNLTLLHGVLSLKKNKRNLNKNNSIIIAADEQKIIQESLELHQLTAHKNLQVKKILYKKYRGFTITLKKEDLEVVLGKDFFMKKINRLSDILRKIGKDVHTIQKIELDYEGKAFIQKKT